MQVQSAIARMEAAVAAQASLAHDPAVEAAVGLIVEALGPALRETALELAQQAAEEVAAQVPDLGVEVVLVDGDPTLRVRPTNHDRGSPSEEDYQARITLRLPPSLKRLVEEAAGHTGDSVNSWVIRTLSARARERRHPGRRITGTIDL